MAGSINDGDSDLFSILHQTRHTDQTIGQLTRDDHTMPRNDSALEVSGEAPYFVFCKFCSDFSEASWAMSVSYRLSAIGRITDTFGIEP